MSFKDPYTVLGLNRGASKREIKTAYRRLVLKYHPDRNSSSEATRRFLEIKNAYEQLQDDRYIENYRDSVSRKEASEYIRRERKKAWERAEQQRRKKKEAEEKFRKSELYDLILILRYAGNGLLLGFAVTAVLFPFILALVIEPAVLIATFYFVIIGGFLLWHIYDKRSTWFRLGTLNTTPEKLINLFRIPAEKPSGEKCCYARGEKAGGNPYRIELVRILDIRVISFGALNHEARYKRRTAAVSNPRSIRAQFWHRISTLIKIVVIILTLFLFPLSSLIWRFLAGLLMAGMLSRIVLAIVRVKPKSTFLLTPALLIKISAWIAALASISHAGPGFDLQVNGNVYIVVAGLFFLLDMLFDLLFGFFPFYRDLYKPLIRQRKVLTSLYDEGYQNYQELPFISILFPFYKWIF